MEIQAKFAGKRTFLAKGESNHWVTFDTRESSGGSGAASSPMEMVLMAMASCSGLDVVSILEKRRVTLQNFEMTVQGERAESHPRVYTKIHMIYDITSPDVSEKEVDRAIRLSHDTYCSVSKMLEHTADITFEYNITRPEPVESPAD